MKTNKLPAGWNKTDAPATIWSAGTVFVWATGFSPPCWLNTQERISIRPGETGKAAFLRQTGETLEEGEFIFSSDM